MTSPGRIDMPEVLKLLVRNRNARVFVFSESFTCVFRRKVRFRGPRKVRFRGSARPRKVTFRTPRKVRFRGLMHPDRSNMSFVGLAGALS